MPHIKILYRNNTYGPLHAPCSLRFLCETLRISPRAMPTLQSLDRSQPIVVVDLKQNVTDGFYELLVSGDVEYNIELDGPYLATSRQLPIRSQNQATSQSAQSREMTYMFKTEETLEKDDSEFPLGEQDMAECLSAMMTLISSIPPRYIKYNIKLSLQIETALVEGDTWLMQLILGLVVCRKLIKVTMVGPSKSPLFNIGLLVLIKE